MPHFGARPARHSVCAVRAPWGAAAGRSTRALGVMRTATFLTMALLTGSALGGNYVDPTPQGPRLRLGFPHLALKGDDGERVVSIEVVVTCGSIVGVTRIPNDWTLVMPGPSSGVTTLKASADHGAAYLWKLETWNQSIQITPDDMSCFDVSAVVVTERGDSAQATEHRFTKHQLRLAK